MAKKFEKKHVLYTIDESKVKRDYLEAFIAMKKTIKRYIFLRGILAFTIIIPIVIAGAIIFVIIEKIFERTISIDDLGSLLILLILIYIPILRILDNRLHIDIEKMKIAYRQQEFEVFGKNIIRFNDESFDWLITAMKETPHKIKARKK